MNLSWIQKWQINYLKQNILETNTNNKYDNFSYLSFFLSFFFFFTLHIDSIDIHNYATKRNFHRPFIEKSTYLNYCAIENWELFSKSRITKYFKIFKKFTYRVTNIFILSILQFQNQKIFSSIIRRNIIFQCRARNERKE